jgi:ATP-dependent DNA ligase
LTTRLPAIAAAAERAKATSFTAQAAILYAFDLIERDGEDLCNLPFLDRKPALASG